MMDGVSAFLLSLMVVLVVGGGALLIWDSSKNGVNDCSDNPQYCKTNEQLIKQWPQFHQHDDEGNVVVVGEPSKELEEHTH